MHVEAAEIDGVEHQRREATFAGYVGNQPAQERENERRAIYEQEGLQRLLRQVLDAMLAASPTPLSARYSSDSL